MKVKCKTCNDKGIVKTNTIAGEMKDYCPNCNWAGKGISWKTAQKRLRDHIKNNAYES